MGRAANSEQPMADAPKEVRQFLEQARNFYQAKTYTAARPIDNPSTPGPPIPVVCPPIPCFVPQPCMGYMNSGWTHELDEFSEE